VARQVGARRGRADGHRLELPPRASPDSERSHYVITNGGDQPNVVPPNASVWYYFRETSYEEIKKLWDIGDKMAQAAAMMTDTQVTSTCPRFGLARATSTRPSPRRCTPTSRKWAAAMDRRDQKLAKSLQHELKVPRSRHGDEAAADARAES
jgi:aminobenzoyl-glutamate utilization protein B